MKFTADLHIHSKYSRATAKNLDFETLYYHARIKGIQVVGTGDFTFPAWVEQIETVLEPAEPGLFKLRDDLARQIDKTVPGTCGRPVRFMLQTEISNIYKKDDRVRKNHNLVFFPDLEKVKQFNARLDRIGNITSDGRPILGLDAADLLELMLEVSEAGFFVPAHIWTPWFSMFGSKSGFDTMADCFGPLTRHIFAVETGLSSDPPMNWRVADLDSVRLISNSDAHSPGYLGRNASVFDTELSYFHIRRALETHDPDAFKGTLDMFPHQGKYHYDGHRKCQVCLNPATTAELEGICPECGRALTLGVLHRVRELADRPEGYVPENRQGFTHIIPLADILSEIYQVGPKTKKVTTAYARAIERLGPELEILTDLPAAEIRKANIPLLAEAVEKMRRGEVHIDPGYDGEFGTVGLFTPEEKQQLTGEHYPLFTLPSPRRKHKKKRVPKGPLKPGPPVALTKSRDSGGSDILEGLNPEQQAAVDCPARAMILQAGPGTGKTRTLTARIAALVSRKGVAPGAILALTFTNKAAGELTERIARYLPVGDGARTGGVVTSATFHAFCLKLLQTHQNFDGIVADDSQRADLMRAALGPDAGRSLVRQADGLVGICKQQLRGPDDDFEACGIAWPEALPESVFRQVYQAYEAGLAAGNLVDFEGLIFNAVTLLRTDADVLEQVRQTYTHILVDEYQDLNLGQYELTRLLAETGQIAVIGDPDQAIYGFRGSDSRFFNAFCNDFPGAEKIVLTRNYRSVQTILDASFQMISRSGKERDRVRIYSDDSGGRRLIIKENATEKAEAVGVCRMIEALVGGTSFFSMDSDRMEGPETREYAFSDIAVLYRTRQEARAFITVFEAEGIPFQAASRKDWLDNEGVKTLIGFCRAMAGGKGRAGAGPDGMALVLSEVEPGWKTIPDLLDRLSRASGIQERLDSDPETLRAVENLKAMALGHADLPGFLNRISLNRDADLVDGRAQKVSLLTMHAAKGLEFPVVFVAGCEQGLIPYARDGQRVEDPEEERRLFYVAMTRAMEILCLTYARKRRIYGVNKKQQPSLFIRDIKRKLIRMETAPARRPRAVKETQMELF